MANNRRHDVTGALTSGWFFLLLWLGFTLPMWAQAALPLEDSPAQIPELEYWPPNPELNALDPQQAVVFLASQQGKSIAADKASFGYTDAFYWFRLRLENTTQETQERFLVVHAPQLDDVLFLESHDGTLLRRFTTGENYPFSQRLVNLPEYIFPITLAPGQQTTYYFRVQSAGSLLFPLKIWKERDYLLDVNKTTSARSLYYGLLLFVIIFNFFIYLTLREAMYLYYVLFVGSILLIQAALHGRTFQALWPNLPWMQNLTILLAVPMVTVAANEFSRRFLDLKQNAPRWNRVFQVIAALGVVVMVNSLWLPIPLAKGTGLLLAMISTLLLLMIGPLLWYREVPQARLFTCGWFFLLIGVLLAALLEFGLLPYNTLTAQSIQLGSAAEAVILSLAIAERFYLERNQRLAAQQQIINEQQERERIESFRFHEATHSPTTDLPNRAFATRFVKSQVQQSPESSFIFCLIRLNRYHDIDRTLGQDIADQLLYQLSIQINEYLNEAKGFVQLEVSREGPGFLCAVDESTMGLLVPRDDTGEHSEKLKALAVYLQKRIRYGHLSLDLDPRLGLAHYPEHAESLEGLIRAAKIALDSTSHFQGCITTYRPEVNPYSERRLTLMAELDRAVETNSLYLCFQPILDMRTRKIVSLEGLVRWKHPIHGEISPAEFVPLAEQTGNISKLTQWVLREGLARLVELNTHNLGHIGISLNLSAIDLETNDFVERLDQLLLNSGAETHRLTLELTETSMMNDPERALSILKQISARGISVAMDDFGTGYSSLSYLRELPLRKIKIDRALIQDFEKSDDAQVIITTILTMCHTLGYRVVAEGIENVMTAAHLLEMGCDEMQGFWLSRPMLWDFTVQWLESFEHEHTQHQHTLMFKPS
jgi:EAL domain-containing protein (putative c-di-GMP-specific phosphodiesterase class I)/GGDEF domain-containing protein